MHAVPGLSNAGRLQQPRVIYLHHAQAAQSIGGRVVVVANRRDFRPDIGSRLQDRAARLDTHLLSINYEIHTIAQGLFLSPRQP
jgi:hypothetical protein